MCCWPLLLLWGLLPWTAAGDSGRSYPHRTVLDSEGKYWLGWGQQGSRLAFRLEVRTAGYVGFGFSPTGTMAAADIVVGGVTHGRPYLQVRASPPGSRPARARVQATPGPPGLSPRASLEKPRVSEAPRTLTLAVRFCTSGAGGARVWAPNLPGALRSESSPRETEHLEPRQFFFSQHFPAPAPHLINPPRTHLPRSVPLYPQWERSGTPSFGDLRNSSGRGSGEKAWYFAVLLSRVGNLRTSPWLAILQPPGAGLKSATSSGENSERKVLENRLKKFVIASVV